jgi:diphthamide synthase subunit DPH2
MLILLDIDGVLVPANSWKRPEFLADGFFAFSNKAAIALQKIITETDAEIVLTTSHKHKYEIEEWQNIFENRNIKVKKIKRLPENKSFLNRKEEILNWFNTNEIQESFIIIDDDKSLNSLPKFLKDKLIQPSPLVGLTDELADEALKIIEKQIYSFV